ncbi:MAG: hypothetical protein ACI8ZB_002596 [Desulforhopalus sp.]|jgi:hypothetical protein
MKFTTTIKKFLGRHKVLTTLVVLLFLVTSITHKYGPYIGKVVDAETGEPLEGVVIYREFYTNSPNPGGATGHFAGAAETLTDANGEFELSYRAFVFHPFCLWDPWPILMIFKPGYGVYPKHRASFSVPENKEGFALPEGEYVTVNLPQLTTREERSVNQSSVHFRSDLVPYEKRKHITDLKNQERAYLGFQPVGVR